MQTTPQVPVVTGHLEARLSVDQKLPCLQTESMHSFNDLLSGGGSLACVDKRQSSNVRQPNDYGCGTLRCKLEELRLAPCEVSEKSSPWFLSVRQICSL